MINVYFISGMGASCKVFDSLWLPDQYEKHYIEWKTPVRNESVQDYTKRLIVEINTAQPFILVGYSFGGIIVQEMNQYISPEKTILLASIKDKQQEPFTFPIGRFVKAEKWIKPWLFNEKMVSWFFNRFVYKTKEQINIKELLPQLNASYMCWAIQTILHWQPTINIRELYQIHGTKDQTFPYRKIACSYKDNTNRFFTIENTGHLLALEKPNEVSKALACILERSPMSLT